MAVRTAALRLLRGEECFVFRLSHADVQDGKDPSDNQRADQIEVVPTADEQAAIELVAPATAATGKVVGRTGVPTILRPLIAQAVRAGRTVAFREQDDDSPGQHPERRAIR